MNTKLKTSLIFMALSSVAHSNDQIKGEGELHTKGTEALISQGIDHVYFLKQTVEGVDYKRMALVMDGVFQGCPDSANRPPESKWGEIREVDLGEKTFDMLSSVVLATLLADKTISLHISDDECYNTRAKITAVRINN